MAQSLEKARLLRIHRILGATGRPQCVRPSGMGTGRVRPVAPEICPQLLWRLILCTELWWRSASIKKLPPTANHCHFLHAGSTPQHAGASLKRLKSKHGLALRLCKPRPLPCTTGSVFVPSRTQHRLASAKPGGTCLSRLRGTAQEEGKGLAELYLLLNHAGKCCHLLSLCATWRPRLYRPFRTWEKPFLAREIGDDDLQKW